jgi:hypothetical protein
MAHLKNERDVQKDRRGDFSQHGSLKPHTEVGHIAVEYNRVLAR